MSSHHDHRSIHLLPEGITQIPIGNRHGKAGMRKFCPETPQQTHQTSCDLSPASTPEYPFTQEAHPLPTTTSTSAKFFQDIFEEPDKFLSIAASTIASKNSTDISGSRSAEFQEGDQHQMIPGNQNDGSANGLRHPKKPIFNLPGKEEGSDPSSIQSKPFQSFGSGSRQPCSSDPLGVLRSSSSSQSPTQQKMMSSPNSKAQLSSVKEQGIGGESLKMQPWPPSGAPSMEWGLDEDTSGSEATSSPGKSFKQFTPNKLRGSCRPRPILTETLLSTCRNQESMARNRSLLRLNSAEASPVFGASPPGTYPPSPRFDELVPIHDPVKKPYSVIESFSMPLHSTPPSTNQCCFADVGLSPMRSPRSLPQTNRSLLIDSPCAIHRSPDSCRAKTVCESSLLLDTRIGEKSTSSESTELINCSASGRNTGTEKKLSWQAFLQENDHARIEEEVEDELWEDFSNVLLEHEKLIADTAFLAIHMAGDLAERRKLRCPASARNRLLTKCTVASPTRENLNSHQRPCSSPSRPLPPSRESSFVKRSGAIPRAQVTRQNAKHLETNFLTIPRGDMSY